MRVLILGGTHFIGRWLADDLLAAGHRVTLFNRGVSPDPLPPAVERLRGDRDAGSDGLAALAGRTWNACVDVSGYTARQVRPAAELLRSAVERWIFISAVSVYGDPQDRPVVETHPLLPSADEDVTDVSGETYGRLKVTGEGIVQELFPDRCALLRPQVVTGPGDPSGRYSYWVRRAALPGPMLAPGDGSDHLQVIDVRDLARFTRVVLETGLTGPFNLAGPRLAWAEFIALLGVEDTAWVPAELLRAAGVTEQELPLFRAEHGPRSGLMDVSSQRARSAGLTVSDPATTLRDIRTWLAGRDLPLALPPQREAELLHAASSCPPRPARPLPLNT